MLLIAANILVFAWQLHFPTGDFSNSEFRQLGVPESDQNTLEYGAIPYRLTHPGRGCALGVVSSNASQADVVCQGTPQYKRAQQLANRRGAPFQALDSPPWWATVFTSMFMHGGILHIAFNMLFLWIFGNNVEDALGRLRFFFCTWPQGLRLRSHRRSSRFSSPIRRARASPTSERAVRSPACSAPTSCYCRRHACSRSSS